MNSFFPQERAMLRILALGLLVGLISSESCRVPSFGVRLHYSDFDIDFNLTTSQANYGKYIETLTIRKCSGSCIVEKFPDIGYLNVSSYAGSGYNRGRLVPTAAYGDDASVLSNCVPMIREFNALDGLWTINSNRLRNQYSGYIIYKGCEYSYDRYKELGSAKLYLPIGCYYVVIDRGTILDYGYIINSNVSREEKKLPWWITCENSSNGNITINQCENRSENNLAFLWLNITVTAMLVLGIVISVVLCVLAVRRKPKVPSSYEDL